MGIQEKIDEILKEMSRTQINKKTEHHLGLLKAKLAKLRAQLIEESSKGGGGGPQFDVARFGNARVCLFGFPSVGKSTLQTKISNVESKSAEYEFTTLTAVPSLLEVNGCKIQLIDLPGILQGASNGYGKGRQVLGVVRSCDLIAFVVDSTKGDQEIQTLTNELKNFGIRVNEKKPDVEITPAVRGGLNIDIRCEQTHMNEELMSKIALENGFRSGNVTVNEDITIDRFIDAFLIKKLKYIGALYIYNKIDGLTIEEIEVLANKEKSVVTTLKYDFGLEEVKQKIYDELGVMRIYTKKLRMQPDFEEPVLLKQGSTVRDLCGKIHKELVSVFKGAKVWGTSVRTMGQVVGLDHVLEDEDVICINK